MSASPGDTEINRSDLDDNVSEDGVGGLFGSGSEDGASRNRSPRNKRRKLDDSELDSGDDEGRKDRGYESDQKGDAPERTAIITDIAIGRHPGPLPSDGELYLLQFPNGLGINPKAFTLEGFEPPTTDHHSSGKPSSAFSAFATSNNTIRWRKPPRDHAMIQSNAQINRWSDGSLTLQLASNPREQFELTAKTLAQPQINPTVPTPTSNSASKGGSTAYNARLDSHTYLAAPHEHAGLMRNTHHITTSLAVQSSEQDDDALIRLQQGLAAAARGNKATVDGGVEVISISEDPENAKRRAELAEKEKSKMQRRYQVQQERENTRANNVLKRAGLRTGAGLTVGGLEDDSELGGSKARKMKPKARKPRRRNSEYSDDEDFGGRGRNREDEYDENDGFLVGSEEEPEVGEESEEEGEMDAEGDDDEEVVAAKPKKAAASEDATSGGRLKRRRVIVEDEDDDEE